MAEGSLKDKAQVRTKEGLEGRQRAEWRCGEGMGGDCLGIAHSVGNMTGYGEAGLADPEDAMLCDIECLNLPQARDPRLSCEDES